MCFALVATASDTRVMTMGNVNNIVKDYANVGMYPSTINFYRDIVFGEVMPDGEMYEGGMYRFGAHYDFGEDKGVVGLYFDDSGMPSYDGTADNRLELVYGRPFGDTYFGMGLSLYSNSYMSEAEDDDTEMKDFALGVDLGLTMMDNLLDLALSFVMGPNWTDINSDGDDLTEPDGNMSIGFDGRYWHEFNDEVWFVPHLGFDMETFGVKDAYKDSYMMFDLGWGVNIMPADAVLLLFDFGIMYGSMTHEPEGEDEEKVTMMSLPYFKGGFEGAVLDWWDVRFGAVKYWNNETVEDDYKMGWAETHTYVGSGFHFGNFDVDAWVNPDFALNGPYFVSGNSTMLAYQASMTYNIP
jgi:hypothetical protein